MVATAFGSLPPLYVHHHALFVCAMHFLLSTSLACSEIDAAEIMLGDFVDLLPQLSGEQSCTVNAYSLTHLVKYVWSWGPLWTHCCLL